MSSIKRTTSTISIKDNNKVRVQQVLDTKQYFNTMDISFYTYLN